MVLALFVTTLLASLILSCVYRATKPRIETTQQSLLARGLREVLDADTFIPAIPDTLFKAVKASKTIGIVFRVFPQGYAGRIPITVGLHNNGLVAKVRVASAGEGNRETPGLGSKVGEPEFERQFENRPADVLKLRADGGEIDAVTGATISSRAVTEGVRLGIVQYREYLVRKDLRLEMFPEAQAFASIVPDSAWLAYGTDQRFFGLVFLSVTTGYCGLIHMLVGLDRQGKILSVKIVSQQETPGMGAMICDEDFLKQFVQSKKYETISGATISSNAVIKAIQAGIRKYEPLLKAR